jgi:competence protein ComEC
VDAHVRAPRNFGNPGAFDYEHYLARQEIYWTATGPSDTVRVLPGRCGNFFAKAAMDLRAGALDRIERLYPGDDYLSGLMQALLIGQNFQLQKVWTEQYRNTGTFHAIVISGTHIAILAGFFLLVLRICFVPEGIAMLATVLGAWVYTFVAGWGAPCVRSAAGLTFAMLCGYFYRERRAINLLAAVALGFLLFDPGQLFEASFQLTFLAVAFLGLFATPLIRATSGPLARGLSDLVDTGRDPRLPPRVAQFRIEMRLLAETVRARLHLPARAAALAVTTCARVLFFVFEVGLVSAVVQVGLALPMVVYFHRVGLSGFSANLFIVPIMGAAVPVGFVAVLTGWVWVAKIGGWLLLLSRAVVGWHANLEPNWRIPGPPLWLGVALSASLLALAVVRGRWWRAAWGAAAAVFLALLLWHPFPPDLRPGELEMTAIDVGQGDSILVVFPDGKRMLVDAGGTPTFGRRQASQMDIGEDVVAAYLWQRGIRSLDVVALSHAHEDHMGGLHAVIADFHPTELWTGAAPASPSWQAVHERAAQTGVRIVPLEASRRFAYGGTELEVLAPWSGYVASDAANDADSLVLRIQFGRHAFLLTGDAGRATEQAMLYENELRHTDVLKVAHHGSRTSTTEEFLSALSPEFGVISVGRDNSYGHPNGEVLERLEEHHTAVFRTDRDGLITILSDGKRFRVETGL